MVLSFVSVFFSFVLGLLLRRRGRRFLWLVAQGLFLGVLVLVFELCQGDCSRRRLVLTMVTLQTAEEGVLLLEGGGWLVTRLRVGLA